MMLGVPSASQRDKYNEESSCTCSQAAETAAAYASTLFDMTAKSCTKANMSKLPL
jgi:hypothetical protein